MTKYRTIVADPPWPSPFGKLGATHRANPNAHYETTPLQWIADLPVSDWAEDDAHLYLWAMNSNIAEAWRIAEGWGFRPLTILTWCKTQPGVGQWFRNNTEHVLFCTRGKPLERREIPTSTWFVWKRGRHSAKPDAFLDVVESVSPGPYLEMFARRARFGWHYWGNQSLDTAEVEIAA